MLIARLDFNAVERRFGVFNIRLRYHTIYIQFITLRGQITSRPCSPLRSNTSADHAIEPSTLSTLYNPANNETR